MAENTTPGSTKPTTNNPSERGVPYYESLRRTLRDTITKKRALDRTLAQLEDSIHRAETAYLEDTSLAGNIVKGFDNYIKASAITTATGTAGTISGAAVGGARGRKGGLNDADRVFSRSSISWTEKSESGGSTPVIGTPREGSVARDVEKRRNRKKGSTVTNTKDDEEDGRTTKRQKISFTSRKRDDD